MDPSVTHWDDREKRHWDDRKEGTGMTSFTVQYCAILQRSYGCVPATSMAPLHVIFSFSLLKVSFILP
ncbi:MAG: hypothetical protein TV42_02915 [Wolbachia endosymbiont of Dactylopius coccus]|nr:MAG: hypothetical protein TV42_02915 [Wolbachia endosymbiont of Dactylopius coccus]